MHRRREYRRFFWLLLILPLPLFGGVVWFNYYIDPMWCFNHRNSYNTVQSEIDDRQQKTNYLKYWGGSYDTLIIGNSRVRMINHNDFGPRTFNYALSGMIPIEYKEYLDYAKSVNGREFKNIVLGLSFAPTNKDCGYFAGRPPSYYIHNAENPLYRYGLLLSGDVFRLAWNNMRHSRTFDVMTYNDRDNIQHVRKERVELDKTLAKYLGSTRDDYRRHFQYLPQYHSILESIKRTNPSSRFIVFTTPVTKPLFCAVVTEGRLEDYKRWLRETVDVFGQVYHFEYLNSVTRNYRPYYMDGHHYYPETGTLIAHKVQGIADPAIPPDFGMLLDRSNIEQKLQEIEAASAECRAEVPGAGDRGVARNEAPEQGAAER